MPKTAQPLDQNAHLRRFPGAFGPLEAEEHSSILGTGYEITNWPLYCFHTIP
jgi:hypothetical protein